MLQIRFWNRANAFVSLLIWRPPLNERSGKDGPQETVFWKRKKRQQMDDRTVMFAMLTRHLKCVFKSDIHLLCIILMFEQVCFIHPSIASLGKYLLYTLFQNTHPSLPTSIFSLDYYQCEDVPSRTGELL